MLLLWKSKEMFAAFLAGAAQTFWHSSAHVLGEALEACFGVRLTIGPAVEEGFYYDCYMGDRTLTDAEKPVLEKKIEQVLHHLCICECYKVCVYMHTFRHMMGCPACLRSWACESSPVLLKPLVQGEGGVGPWPACMAMSAGCQVPEHRACAAGSLAWLSLYLGMLSHLFAWETGMYCPGQEAPDSAVFLVRASSIGVPA